MRPTLDLPLLRPLVPSGLEYPSALVVKFEPQSLWHEVALTLVAEALRAGVPADLHLFQRGPRDVVGELERLGVDMARVRSSSALRIVDSFTVQTGVGAPELARGAESLALTMKIPDWKATARERLSGGPPALERRRFHLDDNLAVLTRYNTEAEVIDYWRTGVIPVFRESESVLINSLAVGSASESFFQQFETLCDGVLELRSVEGEVGVEQQMRLRSLRGRQIDSRWRRLSLREDGGVVLEGPSGPKARPGRDPGQAAGSGRELAAIMFTDLVGFTLVAQRDEALALRLRAEHLAILRPLLARHGGREVKTMGDGCLVTFSSVVESVRCAFEIQAALDARNRTRPDPEALRLRIGLHVGDVVREGDDVVGDAVNVAARLEPLAAAGGVCVSGQVLEQIRNKIAVRASPVEAPPLKNVEARIEVYRLSPGLAP